MLDTGLGFAHGLACLKAFFQITINVNIPKFKWYLVVSGTGLRETGGQGEAQIFRYSCPQAQDPKISDARGIKGERPINP